MLKNAWNTLLDWFQDIGERNKLIRGFNNSARIAYINGLAPTLLKAKISRGDRDYKHQFSDWLNSGFRIQVFAGRQLSKGEIRLIASVILDNDTLVRRLVVLGWDTLEVYGENSEYGAKWQLKDYLQIS